MPHPGYSPDLSPADYWIFRRIKSCLQGIRFDDVDSLLTALHNTISLIEPQEFTAAMDRYLPRLQKCIANNGNYFERE